MRALAELRARLAAVPDDHWTARHPAAPPRIALAVGEASPVLTRQWAIVRRSVIALIDAGRTMAM